MVNVTSATTCAFYLALLCGRLRGTSTESTRGAGLIQERNQISNGARTLPWKDGAQHTIEHHVSRCQQVAPGEKGQPARGLPRERRAAPSDVQDRRKSDQAQAGNYRNVAVSGAQPFCYHSHLLRSLPRPTRMTTLEMSPPCQGPLEQQRSPAVHELGNAFHALSTGSTPRCPQHLVPAP